MDGDVKENHRNDSIMRYPFQFDFSARDYGGVWALCVTGADWRRPSVWGLFLENPFLIIEQLPSAMNILETVN